MPREGRPHVVNSANHVGAVYDAGVPVWPGCCNGKRKYRSFHRAVSGTQCRRRHQCSRGGPECGASQQLHLPLYEAGVTDSKLIKEGSLVCICHANNSLAPRPQAGHLVVIRRARSTIFAVIFAITFAIIAALPDWHFWKAASGPAALAAHSSTTLPCLNKQASLCLPLTVIVKKVNASYGPLYRIVVLSR